MKKVLVTTLLVLATLVAGTPKAEAYPLETQVDWVKEHPGQAAAGAALVAVIVTAAVVAAPEIAAGSGAGLLVGVVTEEAAERSAAEKAAEREALKAAAEKEAVEKEAIEKVQAERLQAKQDQAKDTETALRGGPKPSITIEEVTSERCYVILKMCGRSVPKEERDPRRDLRPSEKEALKDQHCWILWCRSEESHTIFLRKNAQIDHEVPWACGGATSLANSQVISKKENQAKGGRCIPQAA